MKFLTPIILAVATLGLFFGFLSPQYEILNSKSADLAAKNAALDNSRMIGDVREALRNKYNAITPDDAAKLKKMVPDSVDNVRLILDLDSMASTHGMGIRNVKVGTAAASTAANAIAAAGKSDTGEPWGSIQISFSVSGTYQNFIAFLRDIETSLRIVDVVALGVSTSSSQQSGYYDYDITLRTYWLR